MTDTPQGAWMREYERLANAYAHTARVAHYSWGEGSQGDKDDAERSARTELDAHVRGLVEECERLRWALVKIAAPDADDINPFGIARAALAAPKDAP